MRLRIRDWRKHLLFSAKGGDGGDVAPVQTRAASDETRGQGNRLVLQGPSQSLSLQSLFPFTFHLIRPQKVTAGKLPVNKPVLTSGPLRSYVWGDHDHPDSSSIFSMFHISALRYKSNEQLQCLPAEIPPPVSGCLLGLLDKSRAQLKIILPLARNLKTQW